MTRKQVMLMTTRFPILAIVFGLMLVMLPAPAHASLPYDTYYMDSSTNKWNPSQAVYVPDQTIRLSLAEPVDLFIDEQDLVYVVDKAASRVIVANRDGHEIRTVGNAEGQGALSAPEGVFVTRDGTIYVADSGNRRIAVFTNEGKFIREFKKPESPYLSADDHFVPSKLAVDRRGTMYIVLSGEGRGLFRMDAEGQFTGYFGANKAQQSYTNWVKRLILNKQQLEKETANLPQPIANIAADRNGFIYTASSMTGNGIRKLNAGGLDAFHNRAIENTRQLIDLALDRDEFMYGVDFGSGSVTVYDPYGNALFSFGDIDPDTQQKGIFGFPTSIAVNSRYDIWVADSKTRSVQTFIRTDFGQRVMLAMKLYFQGRYEESKSYWNEVRRHNDMYNLTYQGLGKAELAERKYAQAMADFKTAYDVNGYSQAFWELRLQWMHNHLIALIAIAAIGGVCLQFARRRFSRYAAKRAWPPKLTRYAEDLQDLGYVLIHPYHGFYKLKERKVSAFVMILILALVLLVVALRTYGTGFLFNPVDPSQINMMAKLAFVVVPWVTWIVANYLVCGVKNGEGRFREVFQASVYALAPYLFFSVPIVILSNIVVLEESVLVDSLEQAMYLWLGVMFFVMTQVIHNFEFMETLKNSLITVFAVFIIWFLAFIMSGLSYNLYDFFYQLQREVIQYV